MDAYARSIVDRGIDLSRSKRYLDFGSGFYTTPDFEFAKNTAVFRTEAYNSFARQKGRELRCPAVVVLEYNVPEEVVLQIKKFVEPSNAWGRFVIANRITDNRFRKNVSHNFFHKYDCVIGPTADGRAGNIDTLIELVESGKVELRNLKSGLIAPSRKHNWGIQYSFHTEKAISCLKTKDVIYYDQSEVMT